jgi:hypothetical protein
MIQSYFKEPLKFDNVLDYQCVPIPENPDLKMSEVISLEGDKLD